MYFFKMSKKFVFLKEVFFHRSRILIMSRIVAEFVISWNWRHRISFYAGEKREKSPIDPSGYTWLNPKAAKIIGVNYKCGQLRALLYELKMTDWQIPDEVVSAHDFFPLGWLLLIFR